MTDLPTARSMLRQADWLGLLVWCKAVVMARSA
jgi:hypothetical protein